MCVPVHTTIKRACVSADHDEDIIRKQTKKTREKKSRRRHQKWRAREWKLCGIKATIKFIIIIMSYDYDYTHTHTHHTQYMLCGHLRLRVFGFPRRRTKSCWRLSHRDIYDNNTCVLHIVSKYAAQLTTKYPRRKYDVIFVPQQRTQCRSLNRHLAAIITTRRWKIYTNCMTLLLLKLPPTFAWDSNPKKVSTSLRKLNIRHTTSSVQQCLWDASNVAQLSPKDITCKYIKILMIQQHINNSVLLLICSIVTAEANTKKKIAIENAKLLIDLTQIPDGQCTISQGHQMIFFALSNRFCTFIARVLDELKWMARKVAPTHA